MESLYIHENVRPCRYAFLLAPDDWEGARFAVSLNTALWGGIFNPLVLWDDLTVRRSLLSAFDPDYLIDLTGGQIDSETRETYQFRLINPTEVLEPRFPDRRPHLSIGLDIIPLLQDLNQKRRLSASLNRCIVVDGPSIDGWAEYLAFAFGSFEWLPETGINYREAVAKLLSPHTKALAPSPAPVPDDLWDLISPLQFTAYALTLMGGGAAVCPYVIYVGNHKNWGDLVWFWNIRATGRSVVFIPEEHYQSYLPNLKAWTGKRRDNRTALQKAPSVAIQRFSEVCRSIAAACDTDSLAEWPERPNFDNHDENYFGDIQVAEVRERQTQEIAILEGQQVTPIRLAAPSVLEENHQPLGRRQQWAVALQIIGGFGNEYIFSFPRDSCMQPVIRRALPGTGGSSRLSKSGPVVYPTRVQSFAHLLPVRTDEVFSVLFKQAGYDVEPSEPGLYAQQIINRMGGLYGDCRIFQIRGIRAILDRLGSGSSMTKGDMHALVMSTEIDEFGAKNWRPDLYNSFRLRDNLTPHIDFSDVFRVLMKHNVLRPGLNLRCHSCRCEDWYHVSEFGERFTCRFCFTEDPVNFGSAAQWHFRSDGHFRLPDSAQGSVGVVLSLLLFHNTLHFDAHYSSSLKLNGQSSGRPPEVDYGILRVSDHDATYDLVIGEVARFADFTEHEIEKAAQIANRFSVRPYLAFTTLKDRFSNEEKVRLRDLLQRNQRVIALTREDIDRVESLSRRDGAPHAYVTGLKDLMENMAALNLGQ